MQVITTVVVFILSSYLAATNALADFIMNTLATMQGDEQVETVAERSVLNPNTIPQILIDNAAYQKAAIVESIAPGQATATAYEALVNIYCEHRSGREIKITTGTGFFIDTSGIILTNAHVAHALLLDGIVGDTTCTVRTGNPATAMYTAELLYISPSWVRDNAAMFNTSAPIGTGERDYALLYVTSGLNNRPMPGFFPALPFNTELMRTSAVDTEVYVAGYPAEQVMENITDSLVPKLATTTIAELMTFGTNYADVFSIRGTDVGGHGSSGGPVTTTDGTAIGVISTKGDAEQFGDGALRAVTLSYIDRTIEEETGYDLRRHLSGNIPLKASIFHDTMVPFLKLVLEQEL